MADPRMVGDRQHLLTDQYELQSFGQCVEPAQEEREQLLAALVLIDAPDIERKALRDPVLLPEPLRLRALRNVRADAHHDSRHVVVVRDRLYEPLFLRAVVHQRANATKNARRQRKADRLVALGGGYEDRA